MTPVNLKEIEIFTDRDPIVKNVCRNADWFFRAEPKNIGALRNNGWRIPEEYEKFYEVTFTFGYTSERFYTDEDGYLNLTKKEN